MNLSWRIAREFVIGLALSVGAQNATAFSLTDLFGKRSTKNGPTVRESGYWTCYNGPGGQCVYWIDNDQVIFNGSNPTDIETVPDGRRLWKHAIYVWNLKTDRVTRHADADTASLCYVDGYVRYDRVEPNDVLITVAGQLGKETEIYRRKRGEQTKEDAPERHGWDTDLSCHRYQPKIGAPVGIKVALKQDHGFLYLGGSSTAEQNEPLSYFPSNLGTEIKLGVARWQVRPLTLIRSEFDDSYLLFAPYRERASAGINTCPQAPVERKVYRLTPDGALTTISIPASPKLRCYVSVLGLSRVGLLVQMNAGHATNVDLSVLYVLHGGRIDEVIRGVTPSRAVSPDGCRLALGISSSKDRRKPTTAATYRGHLKVIDFCKGNS
jgi:hypothetical protein